MSRPSVPGPPPVPPAVRHHFCGVGSNAPAFKLDKLELLPLERRVSSLLDLDLHERGRLPFETVELARRERRSRISSLLAEGQRLHDLQRHEDQERVELLVRALSVRRNGQGLANLADPVFMRSVRNCLCSHIFQAFAERAPSDPASFYTFIPQELQLTAEELKFFNVSKAWASLLADLGREGLADLSGWSVIGLHGEFNQQTQLFHIHFHALVVGSQAAAFEGLRTRSNEAGGAGVPVYRPILRQSAENPARQICYCFQGYWPSKVGQDPVGEDNGRGRRRRIPEPAHAAWVQWMAQRGVKDLIRFQGIEIRDGLLKARPRVRR